MRMQAAHDLKKVQQNRRAMEKVARIIPLKHEAA